MRRTGLPVTVLMIFLCSFCLAQAPDLSEPVYRIEINLPALEIALYRGDQEFRTYPIAIGKPRTPTPLGVFQIICKVHNPTWNPPGGGKPVPPGPSNPLGRWWLGLNKRGYGIHGNSDPSSIGQVVSRGCVRLHNSDIEELVKYVKVGTAVHIVYRLFSLQEDRDLRVQLWAGRDVYGRAGSMIEEALEYLRKNLTIPWHEGAMRASLYGRDGSAGWYEVPCLVHVVCRDEELGTAYEQGGEVWLNRLQVAEVTYGILNGEIREEMGLAELMALTTETVRWLYSSKEKRLEATPARLRLGVHMTYGGIRKTRDGLLVDMEVLGELLGTETSDLQSLLNPDMEASAGVWLSCDWLRERGWTCRWSEEEWELEVEPPADV